MKNEIHSSHLLLETGSILTDIKNNQHLIMFTHTGKRYKGKNKQQF